MSNQSYTLGRSRSIEPSQVEIPRPVPSGNNKKEKDNTHWALQFYMTHPQFRTYLRKDIKKDFAMDYECWMYVCWLYIHANPSNLIR